MLSTLKRAFDQALKKRPLLTNVSIYASLYMAAEISQQTFNKMYSPRKPDYDWKSALQVVAVGSTIYPPTLYYWYKFLDRKFVGTSVRTVLTKVVCDQFIMTPMLLAVFFVALSVLERKEDIFEELRHKYKKAFIANQTFWIPMQTINFFFVPSHMRVIYVSSGAFVWINVLCYIKREKLDIAGKVPLGDISADDGEKVD